MIVAGSSASTAAAAGGVERRTRLQPGEFIAEYLRPLKPVIVADAIDPSSALARWTPELFRERYGSRTVSIDGAAYRFADLIDRIACSSASNPAPYFRNVPIDQWAPELLADVRPLPPHTRPNWLDSRFFPERPSLTALELYIGGAGAAFPVLHFDNLHTHAFLLQVYGSKNYTFYPPDQSALLYPRAGKEANKSAVDDIEHPALDRFPLFARAVPTRCTLRAGELLFVPSGWWHSARILEPSITISANTVNATNWRPFVRDYVASARRHRRPVWRPALSAYMRLFGIVGYLVSLC